jgi:hypothetical protein
MQFEAAIVVEMHAAATCLRAFDDARLKREQTAARTSFVARL